MARSQGSADETQEFANRLVLVFLVLVFLVLTHGGGLS